VSWLIKVRPASFRGVPFWVKSTDKTGDHPTIILHEFPFSDEAYPEETGNKSASFSIEAFVCGEDYMDRRDMLEDALRKPGAGSLVHPYRGEMQVKCNGVDVRESADNGGTAMYRLSFVPDSPKQFPISKPDFLFQLTIAAETAMNEAKYFLANALDVSFATRVKTLASNTLNSAIDLIETALYPIAMVAGTIDAFKNLLGQMKADPATLVSNPTKYGDSIASVELALRSKNSAAAVKYFHNGFNKLETLVYKQEENTPVRIAEKAAIDAQRNFLQSIIVASACIAATGSYSTRDDAILAKKTLNKLISTVSTNISMSDNLYQSFRDLSIIVNSYFADVALQLPALQKGVLNYPIPACLAAYKFTGRRDKEEEFIHLNNIKNPLNISGEVRWLN